jgi:hypothetical protein
LLLPVHTYGRILSEEEKGRKRLFLFTAQHIEKANPDQVFSESRSGTIAHKNKKRITAGTQCVRYLMGSPGKKYTNTFLKFLGTFFFNRRETLFPSNGGLSALKGVQSPLFGGEKGLPPFF